ncbi:MAG: MlaD family protein [Cyclobacteriaceae bacterium]|nr:MlaD family protein [Cyclobacteriaceae bacterium]
MKSKEFKVGLFAATALILMYLGFNYLKGVDFLSRNNIYYAIYDNVDELAVSNPVLVNGFAVGRVSAIRILAEKNNRVLVELEIDSKVILGRETKAILNSNFLGSKSILLNLGRVDKDQAIQPRDTLASEVAKGITDILKTAEPVANSLESTVLKLNSILENLAQNSDEINRIFAEFQKTPVILNSTLTNANGQIDELAATFKKSGEALNATIRDAQPMMANLRYFSDSLRSMQLNSTLMKTQQTLSSLQQTLARLNKGDNTASKLLTEDSLYNNLNHLLVHVDSLILHLDNDPRHFTAPLGRSKKKIEKLRRQEEEKRKASAVKK